MRPLNILHVEDDENLRDIIGMLLEDGGHRVTACGSAEEGLAAWDAQRFDLTITDVSLPGISGTEFASRLLAEDAERWIVLCSGSGHVKLAGASGRNVRTLPKPFELDDLEALVAEIAQSLNAA